MTIQPISTVSISFAPEDLQTIDKTLTLIRQLKKEMNKYQFTDLYGHDYELDVHISFDELTDCYNTLSKLMDMEEMA